MATAAVRKTIWLAAGRTAILPVAILVLVGLMVVPVPTAVLDIGFISNITISLAVLMVSLNAAKPLDFSSFPTVLLFATLLRLSLNVASTRVVLVNGHTGANAAGMVIESFGHFLIGEHYVVGIFIFAILMIINLVVVTKGAGRVSEVSARFTLDAMPGKQMAIDADLNAGLITPEEAKNRRQEVATEAGFYGSMDGASKFVKGDAVAGVLILLVNIIGGLILGVFSYNMTLSDAASNYVQLAIGDALVAQIPSFLLSFATASIVTRVTSSFDLTGQIVSQFNSARAWTPVAVILGFLGIVPGMPHFVILPAAGLSGWTAWKLHKSAQAEAAKKEAPPPVVVPDTPPPVSWNDVSDGAVLSLEIGYGLIPLVDDRKKAPLMARVTGIRRQLSRDLGFVIPLVRVRDNLSLGANSYRISVSGVVTGEDEVWPDQLMALNNGDADGTLVGHVSKDPTFGLNAVWIPENRRSDAIVAGYTVVDAATVIATHLNQSIINNAADLFGMDDAQKLLDMLKETAPQLVSAVTPQPLSLAVITLICRSLLWEGVSLHEFRRIVEAMVDAVREETEPNALLEAIRIRIGGIIVQSIVPVKMPLPVVTFEPKLEALLSQGVRSGPQAAHPFEPALANRIVTALESAAQPLLSNGQRFAIVTSPVIRRPLARLLKPHFSEISVLSFLEIPDGKPVEVVAVVGDGQSSHSIPANNAEAVS
ncbi:MAG: flagellar biosynthesis protein FlhA [Zymomonas mobilis]|uniref:flagellar biosynthesis protein FlhA n=1 Tax=Zymomonas mobilis TaxID=542 RepID=UPI0039EA43EE